MTPAGDAMGGYGMRLLRRLVNLHGNAVDNAAASVRADDAARDARNDAAEAVALADQSPAPESGS